MVAYIYQRIYQMQEEYTMPCVHDIGIGHHPFWRTHMMQISVRQREVFKCWLNPAESAGRKHEEP